MDWIKVGELDIKEGDMVVAYINDDYVVCTRSNDEWIDRDWNIHNIKWCIKLNPPTWIREQN